MRPLYFSLTLIHFYCNLHYEQRWEQGQHRLRYEFALSSYHEKNPPISVFVCIPLSAWSDLQSFVSPEENIRDDGGARYVSYEVAVGTTHPTTKLVWSDRWIAVVNPSQSIASASCSEVSEWDVFFKHIIFMLDYIVGLSISRYSTVLRYYTIQKSKSLLFSQSSFYTFFPVHISWRH